jgi:hypothetical protein
MGIIIVKTEFTVSKGDNETYIPTHLICRRLEDLADDNAAAMPVIEVCLWPDGNAYTREEWDEGLGSDWSYSENTGWLYQLKDDTEPYDVTIYQLAPAKVIK